MGYLPEDFKGVISALGSGVIRPEAMITKKISIDRVVEDGFHALVEDKVNQVKILVDLSL